jgi:hypothetical protein
MSFMCVGFRPSGGGAGEKCPNLGEYTIKWQLHFILNVRAAPGERGEWGRAGRRPDPSALR